MNKKRKNKIIILSFLVALEIISIFFTIKTFHNFKLNNKNIRETQVENTNNGMFAIFYENEDGEYVQDTTNNFLSKNGYSFNKDASGCLDSNDNEVAVEFDYNESNGVTVKTNKAVYCYLYFDKIEKQYIQWPWDDDTILCTDANVEIAHAPLFDTTQYLHNSENWEYNNITIKSNEECVVAGSEENKIYESCIEPAAGFAWTDWSEKDNEIKKIKWKKCKETYLNISTDEVLLAPCFQHPIAFTYYGGELDFIIDNPNIATVINEGNNILVTGKGVGSTTIKVQLKSDGNILKEKTINVEVKNGSPLLHNLHLYGLNTTVSGNMYRYTGSNATNYAKMLGSNELYRIIGVVAEDDSNTGVMKNDIKLIKQKAIGLSNWGSPGVYYPGSNQPYHCSSGGCNPDNETEYISALNIDLNNPNAEDAFVFKTNLGKNAWYNKVKSVKWYNGIVRNSNDDVYCGKDGEISVEEMCINGINATNVGNIYATEKKHITRQAFPIGLVSLSDYYFATSSNNNWFHELIKYSDNPVNYEEAVWILNQGDLYPHYSTGHIGSEFSAEYMSWGIVLTDSLHLPVVNKYLAGVVQAQVHPTFYIDDVLVVGGRGTENDPFILVYNKTCTTS